MKRYSVLEVNTLVTVLCFWTVAWALYNRGIKREGVFDPMRHTLIRAPEVLSCTFPTVNRDPSLNDCTAAHFDGWSLGHLLIYVSLGALLPHRFFTVLAVSLACEGIEYVQGWRSRWIIDPLTNLIGYALGHLVYYSSHPRFPQVFGEDPKISLVGLVIIAIALYVNVPSTRNNGTTSSER